MQLSQAWWQNQSELAMEIKSDYRPAVRRLRLSHLIYTLSTHYTTPLLRSAARSSAEYPSSDSTSSVCSESHGGGRSTGIFCPLYATAGLTIFILPARGCWSTRISPYSPVRGSTYLNLHRRLPRNRLK